MKVLILLAEGFEEMECIITADVLKRLGYEVILAATKGAKNLKGSHGFVLQSDISAETADSSDFAAVILPGGMPGSANLRDDEQLIGLLKKFAAADKLVCAICAAPIALARAGLTKGRRVTSYPGFEGQLSGADYTASRVEKDGNIITGKGPGAAFDFAVLIAETLGTDKSTISDLAAGMFVN